MTGTVMRWTWGDPVESVAEVLQAGGIAVIPTESSYGLAVDPANREAVEGVFRLKGRPPGKPLPVVIGELSQLGRLGVRLPPAGLGGLERAWPGPVTLLLPCASGLAAAAGEPRLAVRVPGHDRLRRLLVEIGFGVTATSANRSGEPPILEVDAALDLVAGHSALVVDDGRLPGGPPSTMVALEGSRAVVVRPGRVSGAKLASLAPRWFSAAAVEIPVEEEG